ncbi:MAG: copper amine oxidase N-terminal domain-containing protein [Bacillota bacterium]
MYKIRSKKFTILLTLIFVLGIMLPLAGPAAAGTSYSAVSVPTVQAGTGLYDQTLGSVIVKIDPIERGTHTAIFSLPSGFEFHDGSIGPGDELDNVTVVAVKNAAANDFTATVTATELKNEFRVDIEWQSDIKADVQFRIAMTDVKVPSSASGDVTLRVEKIEGLLLDGQVVVAKASKGAVTLTVIDAPTISEGGSGVVTIRIRENVAGALEEATESLKLTLPSGFTWSDADINGDDLEAAVGSNARNLIVTKSGSNYPTFLTLTATIEADDSKAKFGDVVATVGGKSKASPSSLVVAKYVDYGVTVKAEDATEVLAGRLNQEIGSIVIKEGAPGSLLSGRTITLTLPSYAKWATIGDVDEDGSASLIDGRATGTDGRTIRFTVDNDSSDATTITLEEFEVNLAIDAPAGDLVVTVGGTAGAKGEVVVATIVKPIAVTAVKKDIKIGVQAQEAGDITIMEAQKEALIADKNLVIEAPAGVKFFSTPKVEVTVGDLELDTSGIKTSYSDDGRHQLTIPIDDESTKASTISITGIKLTVDRTVPEGDVEFSIKGYAVNEVNDAAALAECDAWDEDTEKWELFGEDAYKAEEDGIFPLVSTVAKVYPATTVTPAPGEAKQGAVFVIGSTTYTVNGVQAAMDVAPYVKDGRTYLPVRYAGYALGVAEENIFWDNAAGTATLIKGDRVVQFTVGKKAVVINGASVVLDVAPEVTNGRVMLPFRWIATAFGANVSWDGVTQTVTMEL